MKKAKKAKKVIRKNLKSKIDKTLYKQHLDDTTIIEALEKILTVISDLKLSENQSKTQD